MTLYNVLLRDPTLYASLHTNDARERQGSYNAWCQSSCSSWIFMARGSIGGGCRLSLQVAASARVVVVGRLPGAVDTSRDCTKG
jgi:hypothetical protein